MALIVNDISYEIKMLGYIWDQQLLFEMTGTRDEIKEIFDNAKSIIFVNADGVKTDYSKMKFVGFFDGAAAGKELVVLK